MLNLVTWNTGIIILALNNIQFVAIILYYYMILNFLANALKV